MLTLHAEYERLFRLYGIGGPGKAPFEVMVGAVLTQNTAWFSVERATADLTAAKSLDPEIIA